MFTLIRRSKELISEYLFASPLQTPILHGQLKSLNEMWLVGTSSISTGRNYRFYCERWKWQKCSKCQTNARPLDTIFLSFPQCLPTADFYLIRFSCGFRVTVDSNQTKAVRCSPIWVCMSYKCFLTIRRHHLIKIQDTKAGNEPELGNKLKKQRKMTQSVISTFWRSHLRTNGNTF